MISQDIIGNTYSAIDEFNKAIELYPDYALAHENLGNALHKLGKDDKAEFELRKARGLPESKTPK